jgi:hypothetical protein
MEFVARPGGWFCACAVVLSVLLYEKKKWVKNQNCQKNQNEKKLQKMLLLALLGGRCYP